MKYEIHNTGDEAIPLSNGNLLAPGEVASLSENIEIGAPTETTLEHVLARLHAFEQRVVGYFEDRPSSPPLETVSKSSKGGK